MTPSSSVRTREPPGGAGPERATAPSLATALLLAIVGVGVGVGVGACAAPPPPTSPGDDVPEAVVTQRRLREVFAERDGHLVSPLLEAPALASRVGVWFSVVAEHTDDELLLEARGWREDGTATAWHAVEETWADPVLGRLQRVGRADLGALVVAAEVRLPIAHADRLATLVWSAVLPADEGAGAVTPSTRASSPPTGAGDLPAVADGRAPTARRALDIEGIEPRSAWNAREDSGCSSDIPKTWVTVHHSVSVLNADGSRESHAAAVRGIQAFHMDTRGYCDIGYHFAVTADGTVWEARWANHLGAHTGSHNTNNAGMVFIGCFHPTSDCDGLGATTPPQVMLDGGGAAIGAIAAHYGITINGDNVIGHRDNPDQSTACPGDHLHDLLPTLRTIASGGAGPVTPPSTGRVLGTVWNLAITEDTAQAEALGARLPGAVVTITGGPSTTANADGFWSFNLEPGPYTVTASLDGFAPASREVQVTAGSDVWASIGLMPLGDAVELTVRVFDATTAAPIGGASITVTGVAVAESNGAGEARFPVAPGAVEIVVTAEGYVGRSLTETVEAGAPATVQVELEPDVVNEPPDDDPAAEDPPAGRVRRVTILPPNTVKGGCAGSGTQADLTSTALLGCCAAARALVRRRRRPAQPRA